MAAVKPKCDFNCDKTGEKLVRMVNTLSGHEWIYHVSCLKEHLGTWDEITKENQRRRVNCDG